MQVKTFKTARLEFVNGSERSTEVFEFEKPVLLGFFIQDQERTLKVIPVNEKLNEGVEFFEENKLTDDSYFFPSITRLEGYDIQVQHYGLSGVKIIIGDTISLIFDTTEESSEETLGEMFDSLSKEVNFFEEYTQIDFGKETEQDGFEKIVEDVNLDGLYDTNLNFDEDVTLIVDEAGKALTDFLEEFSLENILSQIEKDLENETEEEKLEREKEYLEQEKEEEKLREKVQEEHKQGRAENGYSYWDWTDFHQYIYALVHEVLKNIVEENIEVIKGFETSEELFELLEKDRERYDNLDKLREEDFDEYYEELEKLREETGRVRKGVVKSFVNNVLPFLPFSDDYTVPVTSDRVERPLAPVDYKDAGSFFVTVVSGGITDFTGEQAHGYVPVSAYPEFDRVQEFSVWTPGGSKERDSSYSDNWTEALLLMVGWLESVPVGYENKETELGKELFLKHLDNLWD